MPSERLVAPASAGCRQSVQNLVQFSVLVVVAPEKRIWPRGRRAAEELADSHIELAKPGDLG